MHGDQESVVCPTYSRQSPSKEKGNLTWREAPHASLKPGGQHRWGGRPRSLKLRANGLREEPHGLGPLPGKRRVPPPWKDAFTRQSCRCHGAHPVWTGPFFLFCRSLSRAHSELKQWSLSEQELFSTGRQKGRLEAPGNHGRGQTGLTTGKSSRASLHRPAEAAQQGRWSPILHSWLNIFKRDPSRALLLTARVEGSRQQWPVQGSLDKVGFCFNLSGVCCLCQSQGPPLHWPSQPTQGLVLVGVAMFNLFNLCFILTAFTW